MYHHLIKCLSIYLSRSTSTVEDIFDKLEIWNRNDSQQVPLEHSKEYTLRKLLLHSENPVKLKEKVQSIELVYIVVFSNKNMEKHPTNYVIMFIET